MTTPPLPPDQPEKAREKSWQRRMRYVIGELYLEDDTLAHDGPARLARWRRGLGRSTDQSPDLYMEIASVLGDGADDEWLPDVNAIHHAFALLGAHQQSVAEPMHCDRRTLSLGAQCRELCRRIQSENGGGARKESKDARGPQYADECKGIVRRLEAAVSARSMKELVGHVRGLVPMLRKSELPLDYVRLATDIDAWAKPTWRGKVARRWAMDFYRPFSTSEDASPAPAN